MNEKMQQILILKQTIAALEKEIIKDSKREEDLHQKQLLLNTVLANVAQAFEIEETELISKSRIAINVSARVVFVYLCKAMYFTYSDIARFLNRNHSTVMHMFKDNALKRRYRDYPEHVLFIGKALNKYSIELKDIL